MPVFIIYKVVTLRSNKLATNFQPRLADFSRSAPHVGIKTARSRIAQYCKMRAIIFDSLPENDRGFHECSSLVELVNLGTKNPADRKVGRALSNLGLAENRLVSAPSRRTPLHLCAATALVH